MPKTTNSASTNGGVPNLEKSVEGRFGVLPNFFRLASETPEIIEKLWGVAQAAYLDNPLPSVFKERLFVHLSRFCAVRYCIARHVGFLVGLGRPAGDPTVRTQSVTDVVKLLRRPFPREQELQSRLSLCAAYPAPIVEMPMADTQMEDTIFVLAAHVFLKTSDYLLCLEALARLLGPVRLQYLLLFLAFVRAAHYWTETHPEIALEDDINKLLATHEALADCILNDPESRDSISQSLLDELPALRLKADKAIGLLAAIVDSSEDAIVSKTLEGIITSWNASAERLFGYTASEAVGQHISLIIPVNRRDEETTIIERIKKANESNTSTPFIFVRTRHCSIFRSQFRLFGTPAERLSERRKLLETSPSVNKLSEHCVTAKNAIGHSRMPSIPKCSFGLKNCSGETQRFSTRGTNCEAFHSG